MSLFNEKVNQILELTSLDANELKPGDFCVNTNKDCKHFGSQGVVIKVKPQKNSTGTIGNLIRYMVTNKGKTFKPGTILDKTEIQLDKLEEDEERKLSKLANMVQTALDIVGLEPTFGSFADATNTAISLIRALKAAVKREPNIAKRHIINAGISAISILPAGDLAKLIKLRKLRKGFTQGVRAGRKVSKIYKQKGNRFKITDGSGYGKPKEYEVTENYADGKVKGKSRPGRVKRSGASCKGSVTSLRAKAKKAGGEKGKMYHWCANMKGGKKK